MTDKQFQSWVRLLLDALKEMARETDPEVRKTKFANILDILQKTLED